MIGNAQMQIYNPLMALIGVNARQMLFKQKVVLPVLVLLIPLGLVGFWRVVIWYLGENRGNQDAFEIYSVMCATLFMQFLVPLLALIKGLSIFSEEMEEETIVYLLLRPVPRTVLVLGKYLAYWLSVSLLMTVSLLLTFLILCTAPDSTMATEDLWLVLKDLWVLCLGLGAYGSLLMLFGVTFRHSLQISVLFFIWDAVAAYIPGSAHRLTVKHYLHSLFPHQRSEGNLAEFFSDHPPTGRLASVTILLLVMAAGVLLTTLVVKHRQVSDRN